MTAPNSTVDSRLVKALGHPLRQRLLIRFQEDVTSPRTAAEALGEPLGNVAYHTRILLEADCIELVKTVPVRGTIEHFYRATVRSWLTDDQWGELPLEVRQGIFGDILARIQADVREAAAAGGFDETEAHVSRTPLRLDDQGWDEMVALLNRTLDEAIRIQAESLDRLAKDPESPERRTELALLHFVRPGAPPAQP